MRGFYEDSLASLQPEHRQRLLVLHVDDDIDNGKLMELVIQRTFGDNVVFMWAAGGVQGLELAHYYQPDLIISDVINPHMAGTDFLRALRSDIYLKTIPVIMFSATLSTALRYVEVLDLGADEALPKPCQFTQLVGVLRKYIP